MKRSIRFLSSMVILILTTFVSTAYARTIFPSEGRAEAYFPYSKEDEKRYKAIFEAAQSAAHEADIQQWEGEVQHNIDFFAKLSKEDRDAFPGIFVAPYENAISKEVAIYTAYAAMEGLFGYTEDILTRFYPICYFNVKKPDTPTWQVEFKLVDIQTLQQYYVFCVNIQACDGLVLKIYDSSDAVG